MSEESKKNDTYFEQEDYGRKIVRVEYEDIEDVYYVCPFVIISLRTKKTIAFRDNLDNFEKKLPDYFFRIRKKVMVNLKLIKKYKPKSRKVILRTTEYRVKRKKVEAFEAALKLFR